MMHGAGMLEEVRLSYQDQLIDCIMWVLVSHPDLHYYQARIVVSSNCNKPVGFYGPIVPPVPNARSSECPWASIAARRRTAGSITMSRRASCCCSNAIAGNAIGAIWANFRMYLLRQFCSNQVKIFFTIHRRYRRKKWCAPSSEFWDFENFLTFSQRHRTVPLQPI